MKTNKAPRLALLDTIRGITLISMILYHACWDAVYLLGMPWEWYLGTKAFVWQQSICWTFILLSGFCIPFSRRLWRRGLQVFGAGALVTAVTVIALPQDRVVFGVLTLLGSCMLLCALWRTLFPGRTFLRPVSGLLLCALLFACTRNVNSGSLGPGGAFSLALPDALYRNLFTAYLGFPAPGFFSTDYFSLIPWLFLYLCGFFASRLCGESGWLDKEVFRREIKPLSFLGRHSLLIYLLHQPLLYLAVLILRNRAG